MNESNIEAKACHTKTSYVMSFYMQECVNIENMLAYVKYVIYIYARAFNI